MTYYVITAHHQSDDWIELQTTALRRFTPPGSQLVGSLEGVSEEWHHHFDRVIPSVGRHAGKLNLLAWCVCEEAADDDVLIFLDGDAFPIAELEPFIEENLRRVPLAAVVRHEDGDRQPHPLFTVTTVGFWKQVNGDWEKGYTWFSTTRNKDITDVGGNLLYLLESRGLEWQPILRTADLEGHPVYYGVYGNVVYHHGAGFRSWKSSQADVAAFDELTTTPAVVQYLPSRLRRSVISRRRRQTVKRWTEAEIARSHQVFERLKREWLAGPVPDDGSRWRATSS